MFNKRYNICDRHVDKTVALKSIREVETLEKEMKAFHDNIVPQIREYPKHKVF